MRTMSWLFLLLAPLMAQNFNKLPSWATPHAAAAASEALPLGDPDAWVLYDRTEVTYMGRNEILVQRYRLVRVLSDRGIATGTLFLTGLGGRASKVKKVKGWNLRPDGEMVKLDQDSVVTVEGGSDDQISTNTLTGAVLERVVKGSHVAFESHMSLNLPYGPVESYPILEGYPVRRLEIGASSQLKGTPEAPAYQMDALHFSPYLPDLKPQSGQLQLAQVPALPEGEGAYPNPSEFLPKVVIRFRDPALQSPEWLGWDAPARWFNTAYASRIIPTGSSPKGARDLKSLTALWTWLGRELTYKAVYLTPERGWTPEDAREVVRKKYGDCKDLSTLFLAEAKGLGFPGVPALARINEGPIEDISVASNVFNHVIAAVALEQSLGLAAEVVVPEGRFLLVDATDPFTPLGKLGDGHRKGKVMLCLPTGARWVDIPEAALLPSQVSVKVEGTGSLNGTLEATMTLRETGDAWSLRNTGFRTGKAGLRERILASYIDLPPTGSLEVVSHGDPTALDVPFEVVVKVVHPKGVRFQGGEWVVNAMGVPIIPSQIQRPATPRVLPVEKRHHADLTYDLSVFLPGKALPVLPERSFKGEFRSFTWKAACRPEGEGTRVEAHLEHHLRPARFSHADREQGVAAAKKDRTAARNLLSDGFAFKVGS